MSYNIKTISAFEKDLKKLSKKHPSLKQDFVKFIQLLREDPFQGVALGKSCYKIRLAISSKGKGKSGGARIITHIVISESTVYLLSIYDKAERDSISDHEIKQLLANIVE